MADEQDVQEIQDVQQIQEMQEIQEVQEIQEPQEPQEIQEPREPPEQTELSQEENGESSSTCTICYEDWTIGSDHRLCCLKCGHLFGRLCIEKWIKEKGQHAKCPSCNKPARKADIRDLWCKTIKANDTTELCELQKQLEHERRFRKTESAALFQNKRKLEYYEEECTKLRRGIIERDDTIARLQAKLDALFKMGAQRLMSESAGDISAALDQTVTDDQQYVINVDVQPQELKGKFYFAEKVESSASGGCKSFSLCPTSSVILVAQPTPSGSNSVFGAFGLRKYSIIDTNVREFIPLHSKIITSIQLKPYGDLILTAGQDKRIRLTSINNNACVQSYQCEYEPTSVSWSTHRDQQFYVGSGNCYVSLFDLRNTSECIYRTSQRVANTRLLSLASISCEESLNGILVNDSKGSQFLEVSESSEYESDFIDRGVEHLRSHQLPFDGLMGTVDFHPATKVALITTRRNQVNQNTTHNLVKFNRVDTDDGLHRVNCENVRTFYGGRSPDLLSQSRILRHPTLSDSCLIGACDESARGIKLWDASDKTVYQSIRTDVFVRDMILYTPENTNQHILYALSEKGLSIFRWDYA